MWPSRSPSPMGWTTPGPDRQTDIFRCLLLSLPSGTGQPARGQTTQCSCLSGGRANANLSWFSLTRDRTRGNGARTNRRPAPAPTPRWRIRLRRLVRRAHAGSATWLWTRVAEGAVPLDTGNAIAALLRRMVSRSAVQYSGLVRWPGPGSVHNRRPGLEGCGTSHGGGRYSRHLGRHTMALRHCDAAPLGGM
jgi:hypothetical protein